MGGFFLEEEVSGLGSVLRRPAKAVRTSPFSEPPTGSVTLVFTEIPAATRLWERCAGAMRDALELHDEVLGSLLERNSGYEVKTQGGSFMAAFSSPTDAVRWCLESQQALLEVAWPRELLAQPEAAEELGPCGFVHRGLRVRMGVHSGEPECRIDDRTGRVDYLGRVVNAAARVLAAGHGGQVLVSGAAWSRIAVEGLGSHAARPLGAFRLRGIESPVALVEVLPASLSERRFGMPLAPRERQGNVPAVQAGLIGRTDELEALRWLFREGVRLVTLLGPGGMGKTRLATHFGGLELESCAWEGGVWLCELEQVRSVEALCHTVSQTLGLSPSREQASDDAVEQLGRALNTCGEVLIILDNLEQATKDGAQALARWLALAPRARFLVTTREELGLPEERLFDLGPLQLPAADETRLDVIARSEAVRLFVQRAREVRGSFELTAEEAPRVVDIVRRLDGIALAIELAAARTGVLGVAQLGERLSRRFELLRSGRRDASARQATLRGAIDWSWNLLETAERFALAQCSVFRGGFTLEAAEAVLVLPPGSGSVREVLHSLRSRSLLRAQEVDGLRREGRLGMYESIRQYAADRLQEQGGEAALVARHAEWHLALARGLRERVRGAGGAEALRRLALERENLLAACDNALGVQPATTRSVELALEALEALEPDILTRGPLNLLLTRLERALALAAEVDVAAGRLAVIRAVKGRVHLEAGHTQAARGDLEQARFELRVNGDVAGEKRVLVDLSIVALRQGEVAAAWEFIQRAQQLPAGEDRWLEAYARGHFGLLEQVRTGAEAALPHLVAAQALFRAVGDVMLEVAFTTHCAVALGETGHVGQAVALVTEAMTRAASVGDQAGHTLARLHLGCFLLEEGKALESREHLTAAMRMARQLGARQLEGTAMGELGRAELSLGELAQARYWLAEAVSALEGVDRWHALRFAAHRAAVEAVLGDHQAALACFSALDEEPEVKADPVLRQLVTLLSTASELAMAGESLVDGTKAREVARRRVAALQGTPAPVTSSDVRGAVRFLEQRLSSLPA